MRLLSAVLLLAIAAPPTPELRYFHYGRTVQVTVAAPASACVPLDAAIFAHASSGLGDLRLYSGDRIVPHGILTAHAATASAVDPVYTTVAQSTITIQQGHATTLTFSVPAHVPVDRVLFQPGGEPLHFSRKVTVRVNAASPLHPDDEEAVTPMSYTGTLLRLQASHDGGTFHQENFTVSTSGRAFDTPQTWTVAVDNGEQPLQLGAVRLQMLQRTLCFVPANGSGYVLRYGDAALPPAPGGTVTGRPEETAAATLGPEQDNPAWLPRPDARGFAQRHASLLWTVSISVVVLWSMTMRLRRRRG